MLVRGTILFLLLGLFGDPGSDEGRRGNERFREGRFTEAEGAYRAGLAALDDTTGPVYAALQNNLGAALHRQGEHAAARAALRRARRAASSDAERGRSHFNAGTAAAAMDDRAAALRHYERVLMLDPTHEAARFNYEYLKRNQPEASPRSQPPSVEPSAYARRLKKKADAMVAERQYEAAVALLKDGLQRDSTVQAYRDFLTRLEDIAQINRTQP